jgi:hypothetical protein
MPSTHPHPTRARRSRSWSARRWALRRGAAAALACCLLSPLLSPGASWAAAPSPAAKQQADAAFDEGRELFEQGRFKDACDKFELSMQLDPSPGTLLNLGNCYEPQGDLLRALSTFEQALADAQRTTDKKRRQVWSDAAKERIASLSKRIPELSIDGAEPGSSVLLDGQPYQRLGESLRQNPGHHQLEVSAPGKRTYTKGFELPEGRRLGIHLPPLEREAPVVAEPAPAALPISAPPVEPSSQRRFGVWPYVAGATGAALLGTSLVTGLMASSKAKQLEQECSGKACDPSLESVKDSASTLAVTTDVLWISGAVILGAGVTLFVLDHGKSESATVAAGCFDAGCGLQASGSF